MKEMKIDKIQGVVEEKRFDYKGFPCVILFMAMGYRCGYVGIPEASGIDVDEIDCHGGITYGPSSYLKFQDDENIEWIGFDTANYGDGKDIEKAKEYFDKDITPYLCDCMYPIITLEDCEEECKQIVDQVIDILGLEKEGKPEPKQKEFKPYKTITLGDLYTYIRNENTRILLMDGLEFVCMALMKSPIFKPYLGRPIAFIELPSDMNKDIVCGAELIITLEVE